MSERTRRSFQSRALLKCRLAYHLRCLREDATDPEMTNLERLAVVRARPGLGALPLGEVGGLPVGWKER